MPNFDPTDPYRPLFGSLSDRKTVDLSTKYAEKKAKIEPVPEPIPMIHVGLDDGGETGLVDLGQASLYRARRNLANVGKGAVNTIFGTDLTPSGQTPQEISDEADLLAGVSPEYRQKLQEDQRAVLERVAEEDYLGALGAAANVAGRTAAESFATIPEVAAGAAATALTGGLAGPLIFGKKIKSAADIAEKIKGGIDDAKALKEANRLGKMIKKAKGAPKIAARAAGQASILTADIAEQQINEYREKYGEEPSSERKSAIVLGTLATTIWQPAIIAQLFIPNFKKELVNEGKNLVKNLGKGSSLLNIAKRIGDATNKVAQAGAGEAAQEYLQTWQEIFAAEITPEQADNLWKAVGDKINDKALRDQALTGGILGGAAGGATRAAISAPAVAAGTAVDVTKATAKGVTKVATKGYSAVQDKLSEAGYKVLNQEERDILKNEYDIRKKVVKEKTEDIESSIDKVTKAETFTDIVADEKLGPVARQAQEDLGFLQEELDDPKNLSKLKDLITRTYKADQALLTTELETSKIGRAIKQASKGISKIAIETAKGIIEDVPIEQVVEQVTKYGTAAVEAAKEIRSSTALGIVDMIVSGTATNTKEIIAATKSLGLADMQRVAMLAGKKNPGLGKKLQGIVDDKLKSFEDFGQRSKDLTDEKTLSTTIKEIAESGVVKDIDAAPVALAIKKAIASDIADKETLAKVEKAVIAYKNSETYREGREGAIDKTSMAELERRLGRIKSRLARDLTAENIEEVVDVVKGKAKEGIKKTKKVAKAVKESKVVKKAAKAVTDFGEKITAPKVEAIPEGKLKTTLELTGDHIALGPKEAKQASGNVKFMMQKIKALGYKTQKDLDFLIEQFPKLASDPDFYNELKTHFEPDAEPELDTDVDTEVDETVVMDEDDKITDNDKKVSPNLIVSFYEKITGCKK